MKIVRSIVFSSLLFLCFGVSILGKSYAGNGHSIKFKITGISDTTAHLARYYGPKQYYKDTVRVDSKGRFEFKGDKPLEGGIYSVILPGNTFYEFIVTEQNFSMESTKKDFVDNMKVKGSEENEIFYTWLKFASNMHKQAEPYRKQLKKVKDSKDSTKALKAKIKEIDNKVRGYQSKIIEDHPESFVAKIFKANREPKSPETPILPNGRKDSTFQYRWMKKHYFDNIDFSDDRIVRTPILHTKVKYYVTKFVVQHPDTIWKAVEMVVDMSRANEEVFKYNCVWLFNHFARSKFMGMDAIYVKMAEKYYISGEAHWVDTTSLYKIKENAKTLKPLLIGKIAPNIVTKSREGKYIPLHSLNSRFTLICFWDPDCGHCKKEMPKVKTLYDEYKPKGLVVYAVCTEVEEEKWIKYSDKHEYDWLNMADFEFRSPFRELYDIRSTPKLFLLDRNKKIIAKKLGAGQLGKFIDRKIKEEDKKAEGKKLGKK
ncbi:redoxin domain-containing protein [bacterium AH-315-C07]|nr:redoxin domain-containing protein [bacterium AH-315-C07]